jgi:hypothetical protein
MSCKPAHAYGQREDLWFYHPDGDTPEHLKKEAPDTSMDARTTAIYNSSCSIKSPTMRIFYRSTGGVCEIL